VRHGGLRGSLKVTPIPGVPVYGPEEGWRGQRKEVVPTADSEYQRRLTAYEREVAELQEQAKVLEEEVITLRRRLQDAPKRVRTLEEKLLETKGQLAQAVSQNEKLTYTLREAREHIAALREEVEKLTQPPAAYGTYLGTNEDATVDVFSGGRKMRVALHPGLDDQIEAITDAVELPFLYRELFVEHKLPAPKGILLYGPPGCGKTLIAKAVANSLAKKVAEKSGDKQARSYFLNIKGPELLNKYVGETERQIRLVFQRAREKSEEGVPVIVFFDEMDSLFRTRGTGISSDMESTIVPQLLAEIDGVETLKNVIVIGASNREDLIDPAILRPGRLDVKIKIERPDEQAAAQIFARYLTADLPLDGDEVSTLGGGDREKCVRSMIEKTVVEMYRADDENRFLE